jgi:hypothetical protein
MGASKNLYQNKYDNRILDYDDITNGVYNEYYARYGISLFEILNNYYEKELQFVRKYPTKLYIPEVSQNNNLFLTSIFGTYDTIVLQQLKEHYIEPLEITYKKITIENYLQSLIADDQPILSVNSYKIRSYKSDLFASITFFILDSHSSIDIIDFINLRATGLKIIPISTQVLDKEQTNIFVLEMAKKYKPNSNEFPDIRFLKSRTLNAHWAGTSYRFNSQPPSTSVVTQAEAMTPSFGLFS